MLLRSVVFFLIIAGSLTSYRSVATNKIQKKITVVGIALNEKDAAIVNADDGLHYIVDGLDEWSDKYYHKKVKVRGVLVIEYHKQQSTDSVQVQERIGTWRIIKHAKWQLIE